MKKPNYDIVIIGAGIVGLTLACLLAKSRLKIAVLDQQMLQVQQDKNNVDLRVSAITLASQRIFDHLDVWEKIISHRVSPFRKMHVWDATGNGVINFNSSDVGEETLGFIVENNLMQSALIEQIKLFSNIDLIFPATLENFQISDEQVNLQLNESQFLTTQLLVGADGAKSRVRELAKIDMKSWDYGHNALVATVESELPHLETAQQCFLKEGILAFLPLAHSHTSSIVWSASPQQAEDLLNLDENKFREKLSETFENKLGAINKISKRAMFPLKMQHVKKYVLDRIALVGDCAHTIHPLAGQGVNLGMLDAKKLAEVILNAHEKNRSIGSLATLRRYERFRKSENHLMMSVVEGIKQLFSRDEMSLRLLRSFGLTATDKMKSVKNFLMRRAMGI